MQQVAFEIFQTAWGKAGMVVRGKALVSFYLPSVGREVERQIQSRWPAAIRVRGILPAFQQAVRNYFEGAKVRFDVPIDLTDQPNFRQAVLRACRRIPYGKTASYKDLARAVGSPQAARGVGGAMANNPIPLVIPCHRVVRSDGSMGGFSALEGVGLKRRLLELEGALEQRAGQVSREESEGGAWKSREEAFYNQRRPRRLLQH